MISRLSGKQFDDPTYHTLKDVIMNCEEFAIPSAISSGEIRHIPMFFDFCEETPLLLDSGVDVGMNDPLQEQCKCEDIM